MKSQVTALMGLLAAVSGATAQEEKSAELKVLDHLVGTWDVSVTVKPADGDELKFDTVSHRSWSTRGTFIHFDDSNRPGEPEFQMLLTYDPEAGNYPGVMMSGPGRSEITGTWDEKTRTMSFKATLPDGTRMKSYHRFVGANRAEAAGVFKNPAGDVVMEIAWEQTRRNEKPLGAVPTVDELLASYHEAIGGLEANKKITTRQFEGTASFVGAPDPFKMTLVQKAPNLSYTKVEVPGFGTALEGHDGKVAWKSSEAEGTIELQGEERVQKLRDYQFYKYLDLKSEFKQVVSKGRETLKGKTYDVLAVTREDGSGETLYFDARSHLLEVVKRPDITVEMSDYVKIDGIPYQRTVTVSAPDGTVIVTFRFKTIKHGGEVDDSLFARPK